MANNLTQTFSPDELPGTYYKLYVNGFDVVTYPFTFNIGTTPVTVARTGNLWSLSFINPQNVVIPLTSFTNSYLMFSNMDVYLFSSFDDNVFAYMLYSNGNSYIFNYQGQLLTKITSLVYVNRWAISPSKAEARFYLCGTNSFTHVNYANVQIIFDLLTLDQIVDSLQPANIAIVTLVNGVAILTNPDLTPTSIIKSILVTPGGAAGDATGVYIPSAIIGNTVTITSASSTDQSSIVVVW